MTIVLATKNAGKIRELSELLSPLFPAEIKSLADFPDIDKLDIEETGDTYQQNATLKAKVIAEKTHLPTIADDSGLEVEALDHFPGVNSARWKAGNDQERNTALLKKLATSQSRHAKFIAVLCFFDPQSGFESCVEGVMPGKIAHAQQGSNGFGYDPIFIPDGFNKTFAELSSTEKNSVSHRGKAVLQLAKLLTEKYGKLNLSIESI